MKTKKSLIPLVQLIISPHFPIISKEIKDLIIQEVAINISRDLRSGEESIDSLFLYINNESKLSEEHQLFLKNFIFIIIGLPQG